MGIVKLNGKTIYDGPIARFEYVDNWCNSMATYYPYVRIYTLESDDSINSFSIRPDEMITYPFSASGLEVEIDTELADRYK